MRQNIIRLTSILFIWLSKLSNTRKHSENFDGWQVSLNVEMGRPVCTWISFAKRMGGIGTTTAPIRDRGRRDIFIMNATKQT